MFYIGQRVVCITHYPSAARVKHGEVYTIDGFAPCRNPKLPPGLILCGIQPSRRKDGSLKGWDPICFRPVLDRKMDISIFEQMLNGADKKEHVDA